MATRTSLLRAAAPRRMRTMAEAGIGLRPPGATDVEVRAKLIELLDAVRHRRSWRIFHLPLVTRVDLFLKRLDVRRRS